METSTLAQDTIYMNRCIELALYGRGNVAPNPLVGAVIVVDNEIIAEGFHQKYGDAHAEVNAIAKITDKEILKKATIYINLEPCAHYGKTPPCAALLVACNFKRVVIGMLDPNPLVSGKGLKLLSEANISTTVGILESECIQLNVRFITFQTKKRPYVLLKWAQTSDGFIDRERSIQQERSINWISHPTTQTFTHQWRSHEQAILVGWKTILSDNSSLTTRAFIGNSPLRIVIDPELKAPQDSTIYLDELPVYILNRKISDASNKKKFIQLKELTADTILDTLFKLNITSVIIEGGKFTLEKFIQSNLWDEARIIVGKNKFHQGLTAPKLLQTPFKEMKIETDRILFYSNLAINSSPSNS